MSQIDIQTLENNFAKWRQDRAPDETESDSFEIYAIEQILKNEDLSDEEIESGNFGGADDGGVDGMYFFIDRVLMLDETPTPQTASSARLVIVQAKYKKSFEEAAVQKLHSFALDCFDWKKPIAEISYLNSDVKNSIIRFQEKYTGIIKFAPSLRIDFYYASKTTHLPDKKIEARVVELKNHIKSQLSDAVINFEYWDCRKLLSAVRQTQQLDSVIDTTKFFSASDGSLVCLVNLVNFAKFLMDENGELKTSILEPNVRDYQGTANQVNKDIRSTLDDNKPDQEFWWLNNGVTILSAKCSITGDKITITKPEIVNGLQTSHEVFNTFKSNPGRTDNRNILLRIIVPKNEKSRNAIIKATNFQSPVSPLSLKATDRLHFDIEDMLQLHGLFYDRRKGEHKRLKKTIASIISMKALAQAVISILLQRPSDARARPQTLLNQEPNYKQIFNEEYDRKFYAACILLDRQVAAFLRVLGTSAEVRSHLRYYVTMLVACEVTQSSKPGVPEMVAAIEACKTKISDTALAKCLSIVNKEYQALGANEKTAKGFEMQSKLIAYLQKEYPTTHKK